MVIALGVHGVKAAARPVVNATTAGIGAPVVSTAEDATSAVMSVVAILLPIVVLFFLIAPGRVRHLVAAAKRQATNRGALLSVSPYLDGIA